jgi:hypothetical protein
MTGRCGGLGSCHCEWRSGECHACQSFTVEALTSLSPDFDPVCCWASRLAEGLGLRVLTRRAAGRVGRLRCSQ